MDIYIQGIRHRLKPAMSVGKGGEADVFRIDPKTVAKIFKGPDHPDFAGQPLGKKAARARLQTHHRKLPRFPSLPQRVVRPVHLVTDRKNKVLGYTMPYLDGAEVLYAYSQPSRIGVENNAIARIFLDMRETIRGIHAGDVVIGDFNDLNVMVIGEEAWFIDSDSFQFDEFLCTVYTDRFVDPRLGPGLSRPFDEASDWYAYNVMLMQSLLFCGPYGGVHREPPAARPMKRITVFQKDVKYPRPAIPLECLPDELLHHFHLVFEKDERTEFPEELLKNFRWTTCACGREHGRRTCPGCRKALEATIVKGRVTSRRIFRTPGHILAASSDGWLYWENGEFKREDGTTVLTGKPLPGMRFGLTWVAHRNRVYVSGEVFRAEWFDGDCRTQDGVLWRGEERIGDVLQNQTRFWVGPRFGFGFYRAGELSVAFVFENRINDNVPLRIQGRLVDAQAYFTRDRCWFMTETPTGNNCWVIRRNGTIEAEGELDSIHGHCAIGNFLFSPTDAGIVRWEIAGGAIVKSAEYPDTEPFVDGGCRLFPGKGGLRVVDRSEIRILKLEGAQP